MKDMNGNHLKVGDKVLTSLTFGVAEILEEIKDVVVVEGGVADVRDQRGVTHRINLQMAYAKRVRDMKEMCEEALNVQDACNLSGVVHSFSKTITDVRTHLEAYSLHYSTDDVNRHHVCVMYASKIASLTGCEVGIAFGDAYRFCKDTVKGIQRSQG